MNLEASEYPTIPRRITAAIVDSILIGFGSIFLLYVLSKLNVELVQIKIISVAAWIFFIEPFLVSFTGGTIGHHLYKIQVTKLGSRKRINIFQACLRLILKIVLGIITFIPILFAGKRQSAHDMLTNSIVIFKENADTSNLSSLKQKSTIHDHRLKIIAACIFAFVLIVRFGVSETCIDQDTCTNLESIFYVLAPMLVVFCFCLWWGSASAILTFLLLLIGRILIPTLIIPLIFGELNDGESISTIRIIVDSLISIPLQVLAIYIGLKIANHSSFKYLPPIIGILSYIVFTKYLKSNDTDTAFIYPEWHSWLIIGEEIIISVIVIVVYYLISKRNKSQI